MSGNRWAQGEAMNIISRRRGRGYETAAACTGGGYIIKGIFFLNVERRTFNRLARSDTRSLSRSVGEERRKSLKSTVDGKGDGRPRQDRISDLSESLCFLDALKQRFSTGGW